MTLESIVPTQELCAALRDAGLVQGKSVLVWVRSGNDWKVIPRYQSAYLPIDLLDAPTASELGEICTMTSGRVDYEQYYATSFYVWFSYIPAFYKSETEARAQLWLWLAKNRPESLGEWVGKERT